MDSFYGVEDLGKLLNLHPEYVRRLIREGKLQAYKIGRVYRIDQKQLDAFLNQHRTPAQDED